MPKYHFLYQVYEQNDENYKNNRWIYIIGSKLTFPLAQWYRSHLNEIVLALMMAVWQCNMTENKIELTLLLLYIQTISKPICRPSILRTEVKIFRISIYPTHIPPFFLHTHNMKYRWFCSSVPYSWQLHTAKLRRKSSFNIVILLVSYNVSF